MRHLAIAALFVAASLSTAAGAVTVDFEQVGADAPQLFNFGAGAPVTTDGVTFSGGTLLKDEFSSIDESAVYATAPFGAGYANPISIALGSAYDQVSLDLVNMSAGTYTVSSDTGLSQTFTVDGNTVQNFSLAGSGISALTVLAANTTGIGPAYDFAIDNVSATASVPEPAAWALMLAGFGMVGAALRTRRRSVVRFA